MVAIDFNEPTPEEKAESKRQKAAITRRIKREVLEEFRLDSLPKVGDRLLISGAQGTGKSRTTAEAIAAEPASDVVVWWLVPTLEKAEEQAKEYREIAGADSPKARVVRGRGATAPYNPKEAMCPRHEVVNRAAAMGVNIQADICDGGCPHRFFPMCGFQRQQALIREDPTGLFLAAHEYLWLPCPAPQPDYVVCDESAIFKASETITFNPDRILDDSKWSVPGYLDSAMEMRRTALVVHAAVTKHPGRELEFLRSNDVDDRHLKECTDHLWRKEEAVPDVRGSMSDKEIASILDTVEAREIMNVRRLFHQIRVEMRHPRRMLNSVRYEPEELVNVNGQQERASRLYVSHVRRPYRLRKETPVLCLDGTGSLLLNQEIFGAHTTEQRFAVPRDAEVYQVVGKTFSRQSLTGTYRNGAVISAKRAYEAKALRAQVIDFLSLLPGKILLVSYKPVIEILKDDLPEHVETAHFGALRGLNSFEDCEIVVVMGREQPSTQSIEKLTRPFTAHDPEPFLPADGDYVLQSRGLRLRDPNAPNVVEAQVHFDPRCQRMLEQVREAEMVQAIDRVRPIFNHRKVFVWNNLPLDLTVDRMMTWPEMRATNFERAFARHGVLPLSPVDLIHCFPDLWRTGAAVDDALRRLKKTTVETQIDILFGKARLFFGPVRRGTYRRKGQRGPLACVLVHAHLDAPRSVLEGMVGELVEFTLEGPPDPPPEETEPAAETDPASEPQVASPGGPKPLPPLAAVLSAGCRLRASLDPYERPPDLVGSHQLLALMGARGKDSPCQPQARQGTVDGADMLRRATR